MNREREIVKASIYGIIGNALLVAFKMAVGFMSHSIAIILDGVNNATDALSSIVTIVGTKLAGRRPGRRHPFGYGRVEYLTSVVIAIIILVAGFISCASPSTRSSTPAPPATRPSPSPSSWWPSSRRSPSASCSSASATKRTPRPSSPQASIPTMTRCSRPARSWWRRPRTSGT